ncbi:MAG: hypothetical protein ISS70_12525 [Phycisphaerae bacterium]|nr:hypothetical protein [Phycisphaerae bacterium]
MEQNLKTLLGEAIEPHKSETIKPGTICSTVIPFLLLPQKCNVIESLSPDPASPKSRQYQLRSMDYKQLRRYMRGSRPPSYEMGIRSDEAVLGYKVKLRPVVVLTPCLAGERSGFPSHFRNCVLCAPLYTIVDEEGNVKTSYNEDVVRGIVALKYRSAFPIPTSPYMSSHVSALILDRIQPTQVRSLSCCGLRVRNKWLAYIREWVRFYATGRLGEEKKSGTKETLAQYLDGVRAVLSDT